MPEKDITVGVLNKGFRYVASVVSVEIYPLQEQFPRAQNLKRGLQWAPNLKNLQKPPSSLQTARGLGLSARMD